MTQQAVPNDAAAPSASNVFERVDSRAQALFDKLSGETRTEQADDEVDAPASPAKTGSEPVAAPAAAAPAEEESKFDRILKLEQESLRKSQAAKQAHREAEAKMKAAEERAKKAEELEKLWNGADDNDDRILELLEQKVGPEKLIKWFEAQADPVKRAARVAESSSKKELDPVLQRLKALEEERDALKAKEARSSGEKAFEDHVTQLAEANPLTARMMKASRAEVIQRADAVIDFFNAPKEKGGLGLRFGEDYNLVDVIERVEGDLKRYRDALTEQAEAKAEGSEQTIPSPTKTPESTAAAKAKTVSNRDASDRSTLSNEAPKMSLAERTAAAERKLRRQG